MFIENVFSTRSSQCNIRHNYRFFFVVVTLDWMRSCVNSIFGKGCGQWIHRVARLSVFVGVVVGSGVICWRYFELKIDGYQILSKTGNERVDKIFTLNVECM